MKIIITYLKKQSIELFTAFVLAATLFFLAPLYIFQSNNNMLEFTFAETWVRYLWMTLAAFIVFAAILLISLRFTRYLPVLFLSVCAGLLIQGNFPLYDIGSLDGLPIDWNQLSRFIPFELAIWILLIAAGILLRKILYKNLLFASLLILACGVISSIGAGFLAPGALPNHHPGVYFDPQREFKFSSKKNVLILVLDTFRSDAFAEIVKSDPKYQAAFKDFTLYANAAAGFPSTKPSVPLILTGAYYDNQTPFNDFMNSIQNDSLPSVLSQNGWEIEGYFFGTGFPFPANWQNYASQIPASLLDPFISKQLNVTWIRYSPLLLKRVFVDQYYGGDNYFHKNIVDLYQYADQTVGSNPQPVFKYIHLSGVHPNYQLDASFNRVDKGYLEQAKASLNAAVKLLEEMKKSGVYDNSLIFILGDHGTNATMSFNVKEPASADDPSLPIMPDGITYRANPLLVVKNFQQEQDALEVSQKPVTLGDIPKTVADTLGIANKFPGYSIFSDIPENRVRRFYYYDWQMFDWNGAYLRSMVPYDIQGDVKQGSSWNFLGKSYTQNGIEDMKFPLYQYGTNMLTTFLAGDSGVFLAPGFWLPLDYPQGTWAGLFSCIHVPLTPTFKPLRLSIEGFPFLVSGKLDSQEMDVFVNSKKLASVTASSNMSFEIPPLIETMQSSNPLLNLCFALPNAQSPKSLGVLPEERKIGYLFKKISLSLIGEGGLQTPLVISFKKNQIEPKIGLSGFSYPEENFTWTDGKQAFIDIQLIDTSQDLTLEMTASPFLGKGQVKEQPVIVLANGHKVAELSIVQTGSYTIHIPSQDLGEFLHLELDLPNAVSPFDLGVGEDQRMLGIAVESIKVAASSTDVKKDP